MQDQGTRRMFRVKDVADMYDVSPSTIYRAIEAGQLDAYRIGSGRGAIRIAEHALVVFEEECAIEPQDVASDPEIRAGAAQTEQTMTDAQVGEVA
jgi:excisionase family DNA binding protein